MVSKLCYVYAIMSYIYIYIHTYACVNIYIYDYMTLLLLCQDMISKLMTVDSKSRPSAKEAGRRAVLSFPSPMLYVYIFMDQFLAYQLLMCYVLFNDMYDCYYNAAVAVASLDLFFLYLAFHMGWLAIRMCVNCVCMFSYIQQTCRHDTRVITCAHRRTHMHHMYTHTSHTTIGIDTSSLGLA